MNTKLLVCIDGSGYADNICQSAAWVAQRLNADIDLLHVLRRHSDYEAPGADHTGSIGMDARSELLRALTEVDEERARLDQKKGKIILEHGLEVLERAGVKNTNTIHRRGALVETILDLEQDAELIFVGKRGEHADLNSEFLGSNLEKVARAVHKPLFVVSSVLRPIKRFLIAYDGKANVRKAVDYIADSPLLKGLEAHVLAVDSGKKIDTSATETRLKQAGFDVHVTHESSTHPDQAIAAYVQDKNMDLLVTGAYSHSRIRSILLGSTTAALIKTCHVPLLLFK